MSAGAGHPGGGPLVVGVDGSGYAAEALRWAAALASGLGAEVIAVHALGLLAHGGFGQEPAERHRREIGEELASRWTEPARGAGVEPRCELVDGNPVTALLGVARQRGAAMIVVGSRGTGGFPGLQLGSTSLQLAQHAPVPVVIVPGRPA